MTLVPRRTGNGDEEGLPWTMIAALVLFAIIAVLVLWFIRTGSKGDRSR